MEPGSMTNRSAGPAVKDPVCGMNVNPATAAYSSAFGGETYYFCCDGCRDMFAADPAKYLDAPRKPAPHHAPHHARPRPASAASGYTCPMHPEVRSGVPAPCPKCGMALEAIVAAPPAARKTEYVCP